MDNLDRSITIATVAKECSLSRSHFSRAFRNTTGHSPRDWLQTARLARAKELLELTDFSVSHVGFECGFADQPHFTRTFAKKVGMTPAKWRLENRPR
ncbi:helix-turn-helix transcriptional regulator [Pseudomonas graminis]|uniref:helix-turn-helix domain-containing protein n=1 Tax=Pseudomonas graminis TaxID=158627 RepID=UPI00234949EA|nr:helix-turn-helix transcriptional regulator [Pseudomonas graminis]MDC6379817.1 helix-turn-helix transcriptional regulator [Pseudomonas graminis]